MNCKKCGSKLYSEVGKCMICGFSEEKEIEKERKAIESVTISKSRTINKIYERLFGNTDKRKVGRLMKYLVGIFLLIGLFLHYFIYIDVPRGCFVKIKPALTELSNGSIKKGIKFLKKDYPEQYQNFCENVSTIDPNISCGGLGGGCYHSFSPGVIDISTTYGDWQGAAKVIIHETCHAMQHNENRPISEGECYEKDAVIPWRTVERLEY